MTPVARPWTLARLLGALALVSGCGGGDGSGPQPVAAVVITSHAGTVTLRTVGRTLQFAAEARDAAGSLLADRGVTFATSNPAAASVSLSGALTATGAGTALITASSESRTSVAVTVVVDPLPVTVDVAPGTHTFGAKGSNQPYAATARDSAGNAVAAGVVWSTSDPAVAIVNGTGVVTSVGNGAATITAQAGTLAGTGAAVVSIVVASVSVTPATDTLVTLTRTRQLTAVPRDSNANAVPGRPVTWLSQSPGTATVDANGLVTAADNGAAQIQATVDGKTGSAAVVVRAIVGSLTLSDAAIAFTRIAAPHPVTTVAKDSLGNVIGTPAITWVSRDPSTATVSPATGVSGAVAAVKDGATWIVATGTGGRAESVAVTVAAVAQTVVVTPGTVAFGAIGSTRQLSAAVRDSGGVAIPGRVVTWSLTGAGTTVSLSPSGLLQALATGTGDAAVATAPGPSGPITASAPVTVTQVVHSILVTSASATPDTLFTTGRQRPFAAAARDTNGTAIPGVTFGWSSSSGSVAGVDAATGLVTAVSDGTATITAAAAGVTGSRALVILRFASAFTLFPTSVTITTAGGTQLFTATVLDSAGTNLPVAWVSRSTTVVSLSSATGATTTATAAGNGTTQIVMTGGSRADSAVVTVNLPVSFAAQVQPIFTRSCAVAFCHVGAAAPNGLNLAAGSSFALLVGVAAVQFPGAIRVVAGDAENSYLVRKLENRNITGARMPDGGNPLSASEILAIRNWINAGAPNN